MGIMFKVINEPYKYFDCVTRKWYIQKRLEEYENNKRFKFKSQG